MKATPENPAMPVEWKAPLFVLGGGGLHFTWELRTWFSFWRYFLQEEPRANLGTNIQRIIA